MRSRADLLIRQPNRALDVGAVQVFPTLTAIRDFSMMFELDEVNQNVAWNLEAGLFLLVVLKNHRFGL